MSMGPPPCSFASRIMALSPYLPLRVSIEKPIKSTKSVDYCQMAQSGQNSRIPARTGMLGFAHDDTATHPLYIRLDFRPRAGLSGPPRRRRFAAHAAHRSGVLEA